MQRFSLSQQQEESVSCYHRLPMHEIYIYEKIYIHICVCTYVCLYIGVQTVTKRADAAVQCSLLPGPPLSLLKELGGACSDFDSTTEVQTADESDTAVSDSSYLCEGTEENENEQAPK